MKPTTSAFVEKYIKTGKCSPTECHIPERQGCITVKCSHHQQKHRQARHIPEHFPEFAPAAAHKHRMFQAVNSRHQHHPEHTICRHAFRYDIYACHGVQTAAFDKPLLLRMFPAKGFHQQVYGQQKEKRKGLPVSQPQDYLGSRTNSQNRNTEPVFFYPVPHSHSQHISPYNCIIPNVHARYPV